MGRQAKATVYQAGVPAPKRVHSRRCASPPVNSTFLSGSVTSHLAAIFHANRMVFTSVVLPSPFGEWCNAVIARLVESALGPVELAGADTIEQFTHAVMRTELPYLVVGSCQTVGRLWSALAGAERSFVVALDDPRLALQNLVVRHGSNFVEATRIVAKSCASVLSSIPLPRALVLHAEQAVTDPVGAATAIARHLELHVNESDIVQIVAALADLNPGRWRIEAKLWWDDLEASRRALAIDALGSYFDCVAVGDLGPVTWGRELFFIDEEQSPEQRQPASRPVDVTGRPRFVIYGPDITLPPGAWSAEIALGFTPEAAEISYIVDVHAETQLAQIRIEPGTRRFMEANLNFLLKEPLMIAVRVWNERAAFDGQLALGHVTLIRQTTARRETREYFANVLSG